MDTQKKFRQVLALVARTRKEVASLHYDHHPSVAEKKTVLTAVKELSSYTENIDDNTNTEFSP